MASRSNRLGGCCCSASQTTFVGTGSREEAVEGVERGGEGLTARASLQAAHEIEELVLDGGRRFLRSPQAARGQ